MFLDRVRHPRTRVFLDGLLCGVCLTVALACLCHAFLR
jgi:hypothetical protein